MIFFDLMNTYFAIASPEKKAEKALVQLAINSRLRRRKFINAVKNSPKKRNRKISRAECLKIRKLSFI